MSFVSVERPSTPSFVQWGAVLAGAVVGLAVLFLSNSLWVALGDGSDVDFVARNIHWFGLASSLVALFVAGLLAGWMSDRSDFAIGLMNGLTVWALVLVATLVLDVPSSLEVFGFTAAPLSEWGADPLWATFWSLSGGLLAALIGGMVAGSMRRPRPVEGSPADDELRAVPGAGSDSAGSDIDPEGTAGEPARPGREGR